MKCKITNNTEQDFSSLEGLMNKFLPFAQEQIGFNKPVDVVLQSSLENSADPLGKTGYYDPSAFQIVIFTDSRHPKDILRSLSHELVHHGQNCSGQFDEMGPMEHGYAQSNPHLRSMEEDAFLRGNMIFRDWCDTCGGIQLNETNYRKQGKYRMKINESKINKTIRKALQEDSALQNINLRKRQLSDLPGEVDALVQKPIDYLADFVKNPPVQTEKDVPADEGLRAAIDLALKMAGCLQAFKDLPPETYNKLATYVANRDAMKIHKAGMENVESTAPVYDTDEDIPLIDLTQPDPDEDIPLIDLTQPEPVREWYEESLYTKLLEKYTRKTK